METAKEDSTERFYAVAPVRTPRWLYAKHPTGEHVELSLKQDRTQPFIEIEPPLWEDIKDELVFKVFTEKSLKNWVRDLTHIDFARDSYRRGSPETEFLSQSSKVAALLKHTAIRYEGDAVWWVDLDEGPKEVATLYDLVNFFRQPRVLWRDDLRSETKAWLLSLKQWDTAQYPPYSEGGPPFIPGVSTAREAGKVDSMARRAARKQNPVRPTGTEFPPPPSKETVEKAFLEYMRGKIPANYWPGSAQPKPKDWQKEISHRMSGWFPDGLYYYDEQYVASGVRSPEGAVEEFPPAAHWINDGREHTAWFQPQSFAERLDREKGWGGVLPKSSYDIEPDAGDYIHYTPGELVALLLNSKGAGGRGKIEANETGLEDKSIEDCTDILEAGRRLTALKNQLGQIERKASGKGRRESDVIIGKAQKIERKIREYEHLLVQLTESTAAGTTEAKESAKHYLKDYRVLISDLEAQGWRVIQLDASHYRAMPPDKSMPIVHFSTSNEPRAIKNTLARLKRSGYQERAAVGEKEAAECGCKTAEDKREELPIVGWYTDKVWGGPPAKPGGPRTETWVAHGIDSEDRQIPSVLRANTKAELAAKVKKWWPHAKKVSGEKYREYLGGDEAKPLQAQDFYTDVDAVTSGAKKYHATHFSGGKLPMLFTPMADGYIARKSFMREGYYHWPISGSKISELPGGAQPIQNLVSWLPGREKKVYEAAEAVVVSDGIPWIETTRDPKAFEAVLKEAKKIGVVSSAQKVYEMLSPWASKQDQECFVVILLDTHANCRGVAKIHQGGRDRVAVHIPDLMKPAIKNGATAIVVCHNHPSGSATPSDADAKLTEAVKEACESNEIVFFDHVVLGTGEYYSFDADELTKI